MLELMFVYPNLKLSCPLATYADGDRWRVWTRNQATVSPIQWEDKGWYRGEYAIHSGLGEKRGLQREGCRQRKFNVKGGGRATPLLCTQYVRATIEEEDTVSSVLAPNTVVGGMQPGPGTKCGKRRVRIYN